MQHIKPKIELVGSKKYEVPLSMNTWEEKMNFLKQVHEEINEKKKRKVFYEETYHQYDSPIND